MLRSAVVVLVLVACSEAAVQMIATPVLYTNGHGGGDDEMQVFNTINYKIYQTNKNVCAAWWVPYDNIPDVAAISYISVDPSGTQVMLSGRGVVRTGRVRIKIYAEFC